MNGQRKRGFAAMSPEKQREIARKGGQAAHSKGTAHEFSSEEACRAGHIGGKVVSANRAHMAAIGRKGGQRSVQRAAVTRTPTQAALASPSGERPLAQDQSSHSVPDMLRANHRRINGLFHQYAYGEQTRDSRTAVLQQLCRELVRHTALEEEHVYPLVRQAFSETEQEIINASMRAHARMKELVQHIEERAFEEDSLTALVQDLQSCVRQHVQEEELEMLPRAEERLGPELQPRSTHNPSTPSRPLPQQANQHDQSRSQDVPAFDKSLDISHADSDIAGATLPARHDEPSSTTEPPGGPADPKNSES